jgi:hypothetical protein
LIALPIRVQIGLQNIVVHESYHSGTQIVKKIERSTSEKKKFLHDRIPRRLKDALKH